MKKFISVLCVMMLIFAMSIETFAVNINFDKANVFIAGDGSKIEYYLDEYGMPYQSIDGEKVYIALSLPSLEVTDIDLVCELNSQMKYSEAFSVNKAAPASYIDLSNCGSNENSIEYSVKATGLDEDFFNVGPFKYNISHKGLIIKTTSHSFPLFSIFDYSLNITYYFYHPDANKWYSITMMNKDCSIIGGFRFQHSPKLYPYGKFSFIAHSTLKSCKIKISTTPYAVSGPTLPQI